MKRTSSVFTALMVALISSSAAVCQAGFAVTPTLGELGVTRWEGDQTSQSQIDAAIVGILNGAEELYKQNVGDVGDTGSASAYYETEFFNSPTDPSDANITHYGGSTYINPLNSYLLVKDGNQNPGWYLFALGLLGWDGKETLELRGFWPNQGAISHVALYGGGTDIPPFISEVPEPASIALWASVAACGAFARRRRMLKVQA